jgi:hypothetical protein
MLESIFTCKDLECPSCGVEGIVIKPRGSENFFFIDDKFRQETRNGAPDVVCTQCDAAAVPVLRTGYN